MPQVRRLKAHAAPYRHGISRFIREFGFSLPLSGSRSPRTEIPSPRLHHAVESTDRVLYPEVFRRPYPLIADGSSGLEPAAESEKRGYVELPTGLDTRTARHVEFPILLCSAPPCVELPT